jgi:hypothetical protein
MGDRYSGWSPLAYTFPKMITLPLIWQEDECQQAIEQAHALVHLLIDVEID